MKAFNRLLAASFKQFVRDRTALFFTFAFPILFMVILGLVFSGGDKVSYDIGLVNNDTSPIGKKIAGALKDMSVFKVSESDVEGEIEKLKKGDVQAVVVIPEGLQINLYGGVPADVKVYYDPSQTTSSQIILSVLRQVIDEINIQFTQQPKLLNMAQESVQAHNLRSVDYLVPGILAMSIMILGLFGSLTMVEWREKKVLKRFEATPLPRCTVVASQIIYRLFLALVQTIIIIAIAYFAFDVQMLGNWLVLIGFVLLGTLVFVSMGYLAVSRAKTTEGAMPIVQILQFPMLFLGGIFFPVDFMPGFMRPIVEAIPVTYLGDGLRQVMVEASPLYSLAIDAAVLGGWLVVCFVLAIRLFRWE